MSEKDENGERIPAFEIWDVKLPLDLHESTRDLVINFAEALASKLFKAQQKYGYSDGWKLPTWMDECRYMLYRHIEKGDPLDVAAYCAFLWSHKESTISDCSQLVEAVRIFDVIKHGDESHQQWLCSALIAHVAGKEIPKYVGSSKDLVVNEQKALDT